MAVAMNAPCSPPKVGQRTISSGTIAVAALSGMQTYEMVDKNAAVASLETPMTEKEWREVGESLENLKKVEGVLGAL